MPLDQTALNRDITAATREFLAEVKEVRRKERQEREHEKIQSMKREKEQEKEQSTKQEEGSKSSSTEWGVREEGSKRGLAARWLGSSSQDVSATLENVARDQGAGG